MATHRHSPGHNNLPPTTTGSIPNAINHNQHPTTATPEELVVRQALNNLPQLSDTINHSVDEHMNLAREAIRAEQMVALESDVRNSGFNRTIDKLDTKIDKKEQKLQRLEQRGRLSKKKKANLEWDMLKLQHKKSTAESFKQNTVNMVQRKYGVEQLAEQQNSPIQKELAKELRSVESEANRRQEVIDLVQSPTTEASVRSMLQQEVASWNGEAIEQFIDRREREARHDHQERLIKSTTSEKLQKFGSIYKKIAGRIDIAKEAQTTTDSARRQELLIKMSAWGESIADYKNRMVHDDETDLFNAVATINADRHFREESADVKVKVKDFEAVLQKEQDLRDKAKDVHAKIIDIQKRIKTETDKMKQADLMQEHSGLIDEYSDIQKRHGSIIKQLGGMTSGAAYEKKLMRPVAAKYLQSVQIVNL